MSPEPVPLWLVSRLTAAINALLCNVLHRWLSAQIGFFMYPFLDYRRPYAILSYVGLVSAVVGFFLLGDLLSTLLKPQVEF